MAYYSLLKTTTYDEILNIPITAIGINSELCQIIKKSKTKQCINPPAIGRFFTSILKT